MTTSGGTVTVGAGGVASGVTTYSDGYLDILSGGVSVDAKASGSNANVIVNTGAIASNTAVDGGWMEVRSGGVAYGGYITNGQINVSAGGSISVFSVKSRGHLHLSGDGTTAVNVTLDNETSSNMSAAMSVLSGGKATGTTVGTYSVLGVYAGGSITDTTVQANALLKNSEGTASNTVIYGTENLSNSGIDTNAIIENGGSINVTSGGTSISAVVKSGGTVTVGAGGVVSASKIASGGSLIVTDTGVLSGITTLANGASATINASAGGAIVMEGSTNTGLVISGLTSGGTVTTVISGFDGTAPGNSDGIEIAGVTAADVTAVSYPNADQVTLTLANGPSITLNIAGVRATGYTLDTTNDGNLLYEVCFLAGSMIRTPSGDVAVEKLEIGDKVIAFDWRNDTEVNRKVIWVGDRKGVVRPHLPDDEAGYPVRVLKNAIADGVPCKDMLITPEHCLFFENRFVPVRMLVNGRSIFYDKSITSYTYHHIETKPHSVIWADGTLTESYLDTGNRRAFHRAGKIVPLDACRNLSWNEAGAPLNVSRYFVEPLFNQAEARAKACDIEWKETAPVLTDDAGLHLITNNDTIIHKMRIADGRVIFMIPTGIRTVRLVSRASRPIDTIGPFVDDRRQLGVLVGKITLFESSYASNLNDHLTSEVLEGWNGLEQGGVRWTTGNGLLPLGERHPNNVVILAVQILAGGPYVIADAVKENFAFMA